jgi:hypothetical protein
MIDTDKYEETDHPELIEFEGETLGDTLTNLLTEVKRLRGRLRDAEDLLENCGYCRECFWDKESISDVAVQLTEPVWPNDCTPLCESCMEDFKEMFE